MIVSDTHKFVFVQIPHTGSTGLGRLLVEQYGGREILRKHSYLDELKTAFPDIYRDYYIIGGVRNPLDDRVSSYFKLKSDHMGLYSGQLKDKKAIPGGKRTRKMHQLILEKDLSFSDYFVQFVPLVYWNPISIQQQRYNQIYRFESLDADMLAFSKAIGVDPIILPKSNKTAGRDTDFTQYYDTRAQEHARKIFTPFMDAFGYDFPDDWASGQTPGWVATNTAFAIRRAQWKLQNLRANRLARRKGPMNT
ncbi:sulfotransferase family 2 domain-containing protein [Yoonia sp. SS1-5]|uniref:Sulfotransferase family 2 domain-containing protein n=1 Tax=Yoonia rhodophyticola TaxID=3137370 RepID=A0AAN0MBJ0_9RHOB